MANFSSTYPSTRPVFNADFSNAGRLDSRITFSRSDTPPTYAAPSAVHYWSNEKHLSSENLLLDSKTGTGNWTALKVGGAALPTVTADHAAPPSGGANAATRVQLDLNGGTASGDIAMYYQNRSVASGTSTTFSVWLKSTDGSSTYAAQIIGANGADGDVTVTGSWQKFTLTATGTGANDSYGVRLRGAQTPTNSPTADILIWGANVSTTGETVLNATTTQIHREYAPTLKSVSTAGQPRFEYSPTDSASMGLLIEGSSTNLLPNGATGFNSSNVLSWGTIYANVTQNAAIAPTGQLEASHLYSDTTAASQHRIDVGVTTTAASHTLSGYFKTTGKDVLLRVNSGSTTYGAVFTFSTESAANYGPLSNFSSLSVSSVGNGWYRFAATTPALSAGTSYAYVNLTDGNQNFDGDGYSGVLFYGLQFEAGAASSLIATVDSAATRAADSASMDLNQAGFSGGPFTVVSETEGGQGPYPRAWALTDTTASERVTVYRNAQTSGSSTDWYVYSGTGGSGYVTSTIPSSASAGKLAVSFNTNDVSFTASGNSASTDPSAPIPSGLNTLKIGTSWSGGSNHLNGHIKRLALYGEALSDTNLQALTS